jgi:glycosyltransferase involved in cell wall biosynthesis
MPSPAPSERPLHVALLADGVYPYRLGGIQRHTRMLALHFAKAGVRVSLLHSADTPDLRARAEALDGFPDEARSLIRSLVVVPPPAGRYPGHYVNDCRRYSRVLLDRYREAGVGADFVYAQGLTGIAFGAARRRGDSDLPPVGVNQHGYEMFQGAADLRSWLEQFVLRGQVVALDRSADVVFTFPRKIRGIVEHRCRVPAERLVEVPNAIDGSWIVADRPAPTVRRRFLFIGRHERRKGVPELLEAIAPLNAPGVEFHFVGPIPDQLRLKRDDVVYHGTVTDTTALQRILDSSDVLLCPSFAEGMPTVVLEAMARGLAVIATDVGATAEWVGSDNGILLPGPVVAPLRAAIERCMTMPADELQRLQRASVSKARECTWDKVTAKTIAAIQSRRDPARR